MTHEKSLADLDPWLTHWRARRSWRIGEDATQPTCPQAGGRGRFDREPARGNASGTRNVLISKCVSKCGAFEPYGPPTAPIGLLLD